MKKVSFRVRNFDKEQFLTFNIDNEAKLDEELLNFLEEEEPKGIVPVIFEEEEDYDSFSYNITDKIHLIELSSQEINAEMVLMVLRSLVLTLIDMAEYRIPLSYLVLNRNYIYVDSDYTIEFICIPLEDMQEEVDLNSFLRNFLASLRFESSENGDYVAKLFTYINDSESFNLRNMVNLIDQLMESMNVSVPEDNSAEIYVDYQEVDEIESEVVEEPVESYEDVEDEPEFESAGWKADFEEEMQRQELNSGEDDVDEPEDGDAVKAYYPDIDLEDIPNAEDLIGRENALQEENKTKFSLAREEEKELSGKEEIPFTREDIGEEPNVGQEYGASNVAEPDAGQEYGAPNAAESEYSEVSKRSDAALEPDVINEDTLVGSTNSVRQEYKVTGNVKEQTEHIRTEKNEVPKQEETKADTEKKDTIKKVFFKTKEATTNGVVLQDDLDEFLAEKELEEQRSHHDDTGLRIKKNIKISRANIVKNTQEELKAEEIKEEVTETEKSDPKDKKQEKSETNEKSEKNEKTEEGESNSRLSQTLNAAAEILTKQVNVGNATPKVYPYLIRQNTKDMVIINKPNFKIGKSGFGVDYSIKGNNAISRVHATIVSKDNEYFIKDNNSTNHTFVNGEEVPDGEMVQLKPNSKIVFGDEEFTFKL